MVGLIAQARAERIADVSVWYQASQGQKKKEKLSPMIIESSKTNAKRDFAVMNEHAVKKKRNAEMRK